MNKKKFLILSLVTTFTSVVLFIYLSFQHYWIKLGISAGPSICNINAKFNCDIVASSQYAAIGGLPVAVLGLVTFFFLFLLSLGALIAISDYSERYLRYGLYISLFTNVVSIIMGVISSIYIGTFCLFCISSYILSFLNTGFLFASQTTPVRTNVFDDLLALKDENKFVGLFFVLIPAFAYFSHTVFLDSYGFQQMNLGIKAALADFAEAPVQNFDISKGLILQKSESPKMTIIEFADFRCPHCRMAYLSLHNFTEARNDVKLIFKTFPLDGTCNPVIAQKGDGSSCYIAYGVYCSEKISQKGWEAHHFAFDNQDAYLKGVTFDKIVSDFSENLKMDASSLKTCMDASDTKQAIEAQALEGKGRVPGTPTIFVNGKSLERGQFMPLLEEVYKSIK
jgi:uncharacterized membrane protein/protein-disulfide isomerase